MVEKKTVSVIMMSLLVLGTLVSAFYIEPVRASGTIYIQADGSISPSTAPIYSADNITYTLTGNIIADANGIVIERDNIVFDGAGHKIQGMGSGCGIMIDKWQHAQLIPPSSNVTIRNCTVELFETGIGLYYAENCTLSDNTLTGNVNGVLTEDYNSFMALDIGSSNIVIARNIVSYNTNGIVFSDLYQSSVSFNNITDNVNGITIAGVGSLNTISRNRIISTGYGILVSFAGDRYGDVYPSSSNSIDENEINAGTFGIEFEGCTESNITGNTITAVDEAIHFLIATNLLSYTSVDCSANNISNDTLISTNADAILFESSVGNQIENNDVRATSGNCINLTYSFITSPRATYIYLSSHNTLVANRLTTTSGYDVALSNSSSNMIYHNNFLNIGHESYSQYSLNTWDNSYPSGGNYWSGYTDVDSFKGPNQNVPGSDGIWDHPYVIDANNKDHYPLVNPWVPIEGLVVRGMDSRIYYRIWNGTNWKGWNVLPGSTIDSPAAAVLGNQLHIAVRGSDGHSLWYGYLTNITNPGSFSGWTLLSGATSSAPTLTSNGTALCLVVRGLDNRIYYRVYDEQAQVWQGWNALPSGATCDRPAAAMLGSTLSIVVRGYSSTNAAANNTLWYSIMNLTNNAFSGWTMLSGATPSSPTLTAMQPSNSLYLTVRGNDNRIYVNTWNGGASWQGWNALPTGATTAGPAATIVGGKLYFVVVGMDGTSMWQNSLDLTTSSYSGWMLLSGATPSAPTLTS